MKVLLQDARTQLFRSQNGTWVNDVTSAVDFQTIEAAAQSAFASDREDMNVVINYEEPNLQLALNPDYCARRSRPGHEQ
jgi:hypothetical protein